MSRHISFRSRIRRIIIIAGVCFFIFSTLIISTLDISQRKNDYASAMKSIVKTCDAIIGDYIDKKHKHLQNILAKIPDSKLSGIMIFLQENLRLQDEGDMYYILDKHRHIIYIQDTYKQYLGLDLFHIEHISRKMPVSKVHQSLFSKQSVVSFIYPLTGDNLLVLEKDLSGVVPLVDRFHPGEFYSDGYLFILSSDGTVIYHPDGQMMKSRHNLGFELTNWSTLDSRGLQTVTYKGQKYLCHKQALEKVTGWTLFFMVPNAVLVHAIGYKIAQFFLIYAALLSLLIFFLQFVINKKLSNPVSDIVKSISAYGVEGSDGPIARNKALGTQELVYIIDSINNMIAEVRRFNQTIYESEERLKIILNSIQAGVLLIDAETHTIIDANHAAAKILDAPKEKIIGRVCHQYICPVSNGTCPITDLGQKMDDSEVVFHKTNGREVSILKTVIPILIEDKDCLLCSFVDISEKKKLESQLRQAYKMEAIGTLSGGIAHDFNNVLSVILGNAELAIDDIPEWSPARFNLKEIRTASMRAKDVVRQLLNFSRKANQELKPTKIIPVVKDALRFLRATIPSSIEIRQNIQDASDTVLADSTQIHQVILNLGTNAFHAMEETGGILEVGIKNVVFDQVAATPYSDLVPGKYVELTISDTGQGIAPEFRERIFDPYFTTKEIGKGTGMGLSVVLGIIKGHSGAISVDSEPGKGTRIQIFLPMVEKEAVTEFISEGKLFTGNENILFVDDEESLADLGRLSLEKMGYRVTATTHPAEALELFCANPDQFDLVITDMTMPQMTGDRLTKKILKIRPDMPIIICTGFHEKMTEKKSTEIGAHAFLIKPVSTSNLSQRVREVLDKKEDGKTQ
ncbi:MAG: response regulator [Desulfobacterales bacterium]|jgi:PAS domain S-box-containing protein